MKDLKEYRVTFVECKQYQNVDEGKVPSDVYLRLFREKCNHYYLRLLTQAERELG